MSFRYVLAAALAIAAVRPAAAEDESKPRSHWSVSLLGGALVPLPDMNQTHQIGLVPGLRIGWTSRIGLGLGIGLDYSPLPRRAEDGVRTETHYGTAMFGPHWTLGHGTFRFTLGARGGVAGEQTTRDDGETSERTRSLFPAASASAMIELHVVTGGALILGGGATQTFGSTEYRYAYGIGGLMLVF